MNRKNIMLGCIADDFTGASDAASFLALGGLHTLLINGIPKPEDNLPDDIDAVVVALKTRTIASAQAVEDSLNAYEWLQKQGAKQFYFKYCSTFDSTPEGNIGPVTDVLLETLSTRYTLICPALPVNGRIVRDGIIYVNGQPLHESPMRDHPLTPMWDSRIEKLLASQSRYPAFVITAEEMAAESDTVNATIAKLTDSAGAGHFHLIPDYYIDAHAKRIIDLFGDLPLLTGGSGLLAAFGEYLNSKYGKNTDKTGSETAATTNDRTSGSALLLAGSCSKATLAQIDSFRAGGGTAWKLEPASLINYPDYVQKVWQFISRSADKPVLVYSSGSPEEILRVQSQFGSEIAERLETAFAELAEKAMQNGFTRFIVAGGETSGAVTKKLGFRFFRIGRSIAPGVPVLKPVENNHIRLVLKSGNFGQAGFFQQALAMI